MTSCNSSNNMNNDNTNSTNDNSNSSNNNNSNTVRLNETENLAIDVLMTGQPKADDGVSDSDIELTSPVDLSPTEKLNGNTSTNPFGFSVFSRSSDNYNNYTTTTNNNPNSEFTTINADYTLPTHISSLRNRPRRHLNDPTFSWETMNRIIGSTADQYSYRFQNYSFRSRHSSCCGTNSTRGLQDNNEEQLSFAQSQFPFMSDELLHQQAEMMKRMDCFQRTPRSYRPSPIEEIFSPPTSPSLFNSRTYENVVSRFPLETNNVDNGVDIAAADDDADADTNSDDDSNNANDNNNNNDSNNDNNNSETQQVEDRPEDDHFGYILDNIGGITRLASDLAMRSTFRQRMLRGQQRIQARYERAHSRSYQQTDSDVEFSVSRLRRNSEEQTSLNHSDDLQASEGENNNSDNDNIDDDDDSNNEVSGSGNSNTLYLTQTGTLRRYISNETVWEDSSDEDGFGDDEWDDAWDEEIENNNYSEDYEVFEGLHRIRRRSEATTTSISFSRSTEIIPQNDAFLNDTTEYETESQGMDTDMEESEWNESDADENTAADNGDSDSNSDSDQDDNSGYWGHTGDEASLVRPFNNVTVDELDVLHANTEWQSSHNRHCIYCRRNGVNSGLCDNSSSTVVDDDDCSNTEEPATDDEQEDEAAHASAHFSDNENNQTLPLANEQESSSSDSDTGSSDSEAGRARESQGPQFVNHAWLDYVLNRERGDNEQLNGTDETLWEDSNDDDDNIEIWVGVRNLVCDNSDNRNETASDQGDQDQESQSSTVYTDTVITLDPFRMRGLHFRDAGPVPLIENLQNLNNVPNPSLWQPIISYCQYLLKVQIDLIEAPEGTIHLQGLHIDPAAREQYYEDGDYYTTRRNRPKPEELNVSITSVDDPENIRVNTITDITTLSDSGLDRLRMLKHCVSAIVERSLQQSQEDQDNDVSD